MSAESELEQAARDELECLWDDLSTAVRNSINGRWSIQCDGLEERIKTLTKLVGPTPWGEVPITVLESGLYQRIHSELEIEVAPDMDEVRRLRESISR